MTNAWSVLLGLVLLASTRVVQAQFTYTTNNGVVTLTGYSGKGGSVSIPNFVTSIASNAFQSCSTLTNLTIPASVSSIGSQAFAACGYLANVTTSDGLTNIGGGAFFSCSSLTNFTIPASVTSIGQLAFLGTRMTSVTIPAGITNIDDETFDFCGNLTNVTIPSTVTSIGQAAFSFCLNLISITIPGSVTSISNFAFAESTNLTSVFFTGNAPVLDSPFSDDANATLYYMPGTFGWSSPFDGVPVVLWNPRLQTADASFGLSSNQFGFNITGTTNIPIVLEVSTNLADPAWTPLEALNLTNGLFHFSESFQPNSPARFYRISPP